MAKRSYGVFVEWKPLEEQRVVGSKVGSGAGQELELVSWSLPGPRHHRRLSVGNPGCVEVRVDGQWCSSITTRRWCQCTGCTQRWMPSLRYIQRTIKRGESAAFLCFVRKGNGPTMVHVDNKGINDGLWRGETRCIGPKAKDATCGSRFGEKCTEFIKKAYCWNSSTSGRIATRSRSSKCRSPNMLSLRVVRKQMSKQKNGAMTDGGVMAQRKERRSMRLCNVHPSFSVW